MKRNRIFATLLAGILCLSLAACSPSEQKPSEQKQTDAQTVTWGDWTIDVPAEWELKGGDAFDENDVRYFSVKKSTFKYFDFKADGEDLIMTHYNYNKNTYTNEQKDVNGSFGGNAWVGFQYSDGYGGYGFEAYTTVDGEMIRVSAAGFSFDDEMVKTVLSSLKHTPAARPEPETTESVTETEAVTETEPVAETASTEEEPSEGAPVYVKTVELKDVLMGIPEGYTELKDAAPAQYVMQNDVTGGKVYVENMAGNAADKIAGIMEGLDYEKREMDLNGMHWSVAISEGFYCFATDIDDNVLVITIDFGATEEEMEKLIFGVRSKNE